MTDATLPPTDLERALQEGLEARASLLEELHAERTDCYRLLHGPAEGCPGLTIDRYGPVLLVQTWREPISPDALDSLARIAGRVVGAELHAVWNHRGKGPRESFSDWHAIEPIEPATGHEIGLAFDVRPRHRGLDPLLFLDLRVARRRVRSEAAGKRVLNLFAYTCGVGIAAAAGGAEKVVNVDFASSSLTIGRENARRNGVESVFETWQDDVLPTARQLAGLALTDRRRRPRPRPSIEPQTFDLVVLDPPSWATGPYGAVDVVRDYPGVFKPALLATEPGGAMIVTNHSPRVTLEDWLGILERAAVKAGRPLREIEVLPPESDFPSFDDRPPLKVAFLTI